MEIVGGTVLVTGGVSGLVLAAITAVVAAGATVVAVDLHCSITHALDRLAAKERFAPADVTDEVAVSAAVDLASGAGTLRILVNCAGIGNAVKPVGRDGPFPLRAFEKVISVNLVGTFNIIRLSAAAMALNEPVDGERGVIINIASVAANEGR